MKLLSTIILALTLLCSCSSKKKEAELLELSKPEWLKSRPVSSAYFYGIGTTPKVGGSVFYEEKAKEKALADLSKQISTKISSEQNLYRMEDNKGVYEYYQSRVRARSEEFLEGYEYVDKWEDLSNYYTFYRLSKSEFYARKEQRKREALQLSLEKYQQAQTANKQANYVLAMELYASSIDAISDYLNEQTSVETTNGNLDIYEASKDALSQLINSLTIEFQPKELYASSNTKIKEGAALLAVQCQNQQAHNMPVQFNYSGGFLITDRFKSNAMGQVKSPALEYANKSEETLKASIDLKSLGRQITRNLIVRQIVEKQKPATSIISIQLAQ
ncbi:LPP20 family lipoprotein [Carboxylicivirga sediminis]|uniref:LPP20 family lipoprotein n=1 Tax=Carboxylicivirga sediminis TaxID=2006564 RepID=A0A941FAY1_9BACT|nr:LPP20 family lipoprotein [Carboxylicivirga sediminis]MBR8537755.1 LPP20 family lipoprotein [Carboxylicivirga sediminis]